MTGLLPLVLLMGGTAHGAPHGGLQQSIDVHIRSDSQPVVETTYGLLQTDSDGIWSWVCEEVSGTESAWHYALSSEDRWILSGVDRVMWSDDQCSWTDVEGVLQGLYITAMVADPVAPEWIWAVTASGSEENALFLSTDHAESFAQSATFGEASRLRDLAIHPDGTTWVVGWRDDLPWVWSSPDREAWTETQLPEDGYSITILGLNPEDSTQAWLKLITADGDRLIRAGTDGSTTTLMESAESLEALAVLPQSEHILLGGREAGLYRSTDGGESW